METSQANINVVCRAETLIAVCANVIDETTKMKTTSSSSPTYQNLEPIRRRRSAILFELINQSVAGGLDKRKINSLVKEYGAQEVAFVNGIFARQIKERGGLIGDEITSYRRYRRVFAQYGGMRPFFSRKEYDHLMDQFGDLLGARYLASQPPSPRENEISDLLLQSVEYLADLLPLDTPPRPENYAAPLPATYTAPANQLLTWGWDLNRERIQEEAEKNQLLWRSSLADVARIATDPGLLQGWPGDLASWAPWHAVHLLGALRANEYAGQIITILKNENDWLGDVLPRIWGQMGPDAEPPLWKHTDHRSNREARSITLSGLASIARAHPERYDDIVQGMIERLQKSTPFDFRYNAYMVHLLNDLKAVNARDAIVEAYRQNKIDRKIIDEGSVEILTDEYDEI